MTTTESRRPSLGDSIRASITSLGGRIRRLSLSRRSSTSKTSETDISVLASQVKADFYREYHQNKDQYELKDVQRFLENPDFNYVYRYLEKANLDPKKALETIQGALQLYKEQRLTNAVDNTFPLFFHKYGVFFIHGEDRQGNNVIYLRAKLYHNLHPIVTEEFIRFLYYTVFKLDQMSSVRGKGYITVMDFTGYSAMQTDIKLTLQLFKMYQKYVPSLPVKVYVCGIPWLGMKMFKAAMAFFPNSITSLVTILDKKDLCKYIPEEDLPRFLGGEYKNPLVIPANCISDKEYFVDKLGASSKEFEDNFNKYQKIMDKTEW